MEAMGVEHGFMVAAVGHQCKSWNRPCHNLSLCWIRGGCSPSARWREAGSFSAAARELSLTQPAVSQQVAALERELGARLLHRGPGGLTLTEAGTVALDHAQALAERLALADAQLAELGDDRGALRVGGFPSAMATLVPAAIASVVPQRVEAVEGTVEQLAAGVADGSLHVAVLFQDAAEPAREHPGLRRHELLDEPFVIAVGPEHRLARRRTRAPARARRRAVGRALRARHRAQRVRRRRLRARHRLRRARRPRDPRAGGRRAGRDAHAAPHRRAPARRPRPRAARRAAAPRALRADAAHGHPRAPRASSSTRCAQRCNVGADATMRRRRTVGALAAVLALACASAAHASSIVYVCAPNLCRIDPAHPKKVTRLTRDGKASGPVYLSPSLSTKGTKLSFVKGNRLYLAQGNATRARRVDEPAGTRGDADAPRRDAGRLHPQRQHDHLAGLHLPVLLAADLRLRSLPLRARRRRRQGGRRWRASTTSTGWLRDRVLLPHPGPGNGARPDGICVAAPPGADEVCERMVASDPQQRTLSNPAASPDGRYLVAVAEPFVRRPELHPDLPRRDRAVQSGDGRVPARPDLRPRRWRRRPSRPTASRSPSRAARTSTSSAVAGGKAKLLRRGVRDPTWGAR